VERICVFTGSSPGARSVYADAAVALADEIAARGLELVYGGAQVGLMGVLADRVLANGGRVVGVIPEFLAVKEVAHGGLSELRVVATMHERKALMAELASAFVALPGGIGTFEETFEVLTWAQLGMHQKPVGLLDVAGYYATLIAFLDHAVAERFVKDAHRAMLLVEREPGALLDRMRDYAPPVVEKWLDRGRE
jgi:uncharacterized protein (TIGR00730 family)